MCFGLGPLWQGHPCYTCKWDLFVEQMLFCYFPLSPLHHHIGQSWTGLRALSSRHTWQAQDTSAILLPEEEAFRQEAATGHH